MGVVKRQIRAVSVDGAGGRGGGRLCWEERKKERKRGPQQKST